MRIILIAFYLIVSASLWKANAQGGTKPDPTVQSMLDSAESFKLNDPEKNLAIARSVMQLDPFPGSRTQYVRALLYASNSAKMLSEKKVALDYATKAINLSKEIGSPELLLRSHYMKGSVFGQYDDNDSILYYYQKVIDLHEDDMDPYFISSSYTAIGDVYYSIANYTKAEEYMLKAYRISSADPYSKLFALASVIQFYHRRDDPRYLAFLDTLSQSDFYKKASPESFMAHFDSFLLLGEANDAEKEKTLREVYQHSLTNSAVTNQVVYGMKLYEHLTHQKKYEEGYRLLQEVIQKALQDKNDNHRAGVLRALYENGKDRGDLPSALEYLELHSEIRDSMLSEENRSKISELNIKFEAVQKDHEIEQQRLRIEQERRNRNLFIALACLVAALAIFVFVHFRNRARTALRIKEQQAVIHRQQTVQMLREKEVAELTATLESQEKERNRIARDLHDGLGSMMSGISAQIEYLRSQPAIENLGHPQLVQLRDIVKEATSELRRTAYELMPAKLLRLGLEPAIRDLCLNLLVKNGIEPTFEINADLTTLTPEQQLTLFRIVQELLNNIVKHAEAKNVMIQFSRFDDEISLVVEDDGKGFDVAARKMDGGLGLGSLNSRVNLLKGFLDIASMPGEGTTVTVNFKMARENVRT